MAQMRQRMLMSSNRTFMELKLRFLSLFVHLFLGSNRTFMELKWEEYLYLQTILDVLIVPLWN